MQKIGGKSRRKPGEIYNTTNFRDFIWKPFTPNC